MNTTNTRRAVTTLVAATAVAGALTVMSAVAPSAASANRIDPAPDSAVRCAVSVDDAEGSSTSSRDIDEIVTMLKVRRAMYLADHPYSRH